MNDAEEDKAPWWLLLICVVLTPAFVVWRAYALSLLWVWLVVPTFDVRALGVAQAAAVSFVASVLTYHHEGKPDDEVSTARMARFIGRGLLLPPGLILLGWIYHSFLVGAP